MSVDHEESELSTVPLSLGSQSDDESVENQHSLLRQNAGIFRAQTAPTQAARREDLNAGRMALGKSR